MMDGVDVRNTTVFIDTEKEREAILNFLTRKGFYWFEGEPANEYVPEVPFYLYIGDEDKGLTYSHRSDDYISALNFCQKFILNEVNVGDVVKVDSNYSFDPVIGRIQDITGFVIAVDVLEKGNGDEVTDTDIWNYHIDDVLDVFKDFPSIQRTIEIDDTVALRDDLTVREMNESPSFTGTMWDVAEMDKHLTVIGVDGDCISIREDDGRYCWKPDWFKIIEKRKVKKPKQAPSEKDRFILELLKKLGYNWVARDDDGELCAFGEEPMRMEGVWDLETGDKIEPYYFPNDEEYLPFVTETDEEPTFIDDILRP